MQINLSDWASLVQDVAAGLQVLPPRLSNCLDPEILKAGGSHPGKVLPPLLLPGDKLWMCRSTSNDSPYLMEPDYGADSGIWDDHLPQWSDYSEYLLRRYAWTSATSTWDFHLEPISVEGPYIPEAGHNPAIQTSCWEGQMAKGHSEHKGSCATGSSDGPSHLSATSTLWELTSNPGAAAE